MSSSLCAHCLKFLDRSKFIDAVANPDIPGTATVDLTKTLSSVAETVAECEICKLIQSKAHEFEDNSPEIKMEFTFGPEKHDIKRVRLIYQGPVSEDADFPTSFTQVLRNYIVHALPGMLALRPQEQNLRRVPQTIQQRVSSRPGLLKWLWVRLKALIPLGPGFGSAMQTTGIAPTWERVPCQLAA